LKGSLIHEGHLFKGKYNMSF